MKHFTHITLDWSIGTIGGMTEEAIELAKLTDMKVSFTFNGVKVNVTKQTTLQIATDALNAVREGKGSVYGEGW